MGLLAKSVRDLIPERKATPIGSAIPTWQDGVAQSPVLAQNFDALVRQGYTLDEVVYACIEQRATSAAEPRIAAHKGDDKLDKATDHPGLKLLANPNPHLDGFTMMSSIVMYLDIGGNAYLHKVRSEAGKLVELWTLRPDRVKVIPDRNEFIRGYQYTIGDFSTTIPAKDIIHFKTRHPLDDYYGLSPAYVLSQRIDLDVWQREMTAAFFRNAAVPSGLLNIQRHVSNEEKELLRSRFRQQFGGPGGWWQALIVDNAQATYTPMGLPLGAAGAATGDQDEINEARICMVYEVPPSIISSRLGMRSSSYANRVSDRKLFWVSTLAPLFRYLGARLTLGLQDDYPDVDRFEFDMETVQALQEDKNEAADRHTKIWLAGGYTWREYRVKLGEPPEPDEDGVVVLPANMVPTKSEEMIELPDPEPVPALLQPFAGGDPNDPNNPPPPNALPPGQNGNAPPRQVPRPANGRGRPPARQPVAAGRANGKSAAEVVEEWLSPTVDIGSLLDGVDIGALFD